MENDNVVLGVFWVGFFFFSPQIIQIAAVFRGFFFFYMFLTLLLNTET